jgi:membrane protein YdbS with pleckstrin-like domain
MTTYKSKQALVLIMPLILILGGFGFIMAYNKVWPGLFVMIIIASLVTHMFLTTYYQIDGRVLKIKSGFLFNKTIAIDSIREITATKNPLSSPATSLDRLEIKYNKSDSIIISPKDKAGFINELKKINPALN